MLLKAAGGFDRLGLQDGRMSEKLFSVGLFT